MTNPRLTFGEMTVYGELARGVHPADELGLQMAMALGVPNPPDPPFATVPVLLDGYIIGQLRSTRYVCGLTTYGFCSISGNTHFYVTSKDAVLEHLQEVLQLAG
jgi:hypothetical protein